MTAHYDLQGLKSRLLTPTNTAKEAQLFGATVYLRRMTAAELLKQEEQVKKALEEDDLHASSRLNVQLIIDSLVTPDGARIDKKNLPTADELMAAHDNRTLLDAIDIVKRHCIGFIEDAEKN